MTYIKDRKMIIIELNHLDLHSKNLPETESEVLFYRVDSGWAVWRGRAAALESRLSGMEDDKVGHRREATVLLQCTEY